MTKAVPRSYRTLLVAATALCAVAPAITHGAALDQPLTTAPRSQASAAARLSLPLEVDGARNGAALAEVTISDLLAISPADLASALDGRINSETADQLKALGQGLVSPDRVRALGISLVYNTSTIALEVTIPPDLRAPGVVSLAGNGFYGGDTRVEPGHFAVGVTGFVEAARRLDTGESTLGDFTFSGFTNVGGSEGYNLLFGGAYDFLNNSFDRDRLVLFKDDIDRTMRYAAGDLTSDQPRLGGSSDLLGVSVARSYQTFNRSGM